MRAARITVSAVGVSGADRNLLSMIADNGDGRLYMTDDIGALPRIFMKETTEAQKSQLVEDAIKVRVDDVIRLIDEENWVAAEDTLATLEEEVGARNPQCMRVRTLLELYETASGVNVEDEDEDDS
jgi:hypothetical protein